ncbi:MAG: hypothetical protein DWQ07_12270 [Chloroflexi bacterium]|nr:MAG: hypothetical protein DWQ07_12270 [Chloroflexota bacterium]
MKKLHLLILILAFVFPVSVRAAGMTLVSPNGVILNVNFYDYVWLEEDDPDVTQYVIHRKINEVNQVQLFVETSACVGGTCTQSVTGQETANYVWWVESVDSFYSTINTTNRGEYIVDLGDIKEVINPVGTSSAPDFSNLHCPEETPANWGTATPNPLWNVTCGHCFDEPVFPTSTAIIGTPTPYGYPTATGQVTETPTITPTLQPTQGDTLYLQYAGNCFAQAPIPFYTKGGCALDITNLNTGTDVVGVIFTNVYSSLGQPRMIFGGNCTNGLCNPNVADSHDQKNLLDGVNGWTDETIALLNNVIFQYGTYTDGYDWVEQQFGAPITQATMGSFNGMDTMTSLNLWLEGIGQEFTNYTISYDAYLLRWGIPQSGEATSTPTPQPTVGPGYCSVIDETVYEDLFDYTGIENVGAPVCLRLGSEVNLLGIYIDLNSLFSFFEIPELFELCFQGVVLGSFTIFGMPVDTEGILIIVGILTFVRWFTRK